MSRGAEVCTPGRVNLEKGKRHTSQARDARCLFETINQELAFTRT